MRIKLENEDKGDQPGKTPCSPFTRPVHQSSVFAVLSTISIRSPVLKDRSPSACSQDQVLSSDARQSRHTWAAKSYSAITYWIWGANLGLGFNGGGGGGALLAAAAAAVLLPPDEAVYGGGGGDAWDEKLDGGGGGVFLNEGAGGGTRDVEAEEDAVAVEAERPIEPVWLRFACTSLARVRVREQSYKNIIVSGRTDWYDTFDNTEALDQFPCICAFTFVVLLDLWSCSIRDVVFSRVRITIHLLKDEIIDIQSANCLLSEQFMITFYSLHVEEWIKQRINELRGERHEARKICLECIVYVVIFISRELEVLFQLEFA